LRKKGIGGFIILGRPAADELIQLGVPDVTHKDDLEKELIWSALQRSGGNISKAASDLGIYRQQLQRKLKRINSNI